MKKILAFAAAAALLFTSCIVGGDETERNAAKGKTRLTVTIAGTSVPGATRAVLEAPGEEGEKNDLNDVTIFILDPDGYVIAAQAYDAASVTAAAEAADDAPGAGADGTNGWLFEFGESIPKDSEVFIVGNVPAASQAALVKRQTLAQIIASYSPVSSFAAVGDYLESTVANEAGEPVAITEGTVVDGIDNADGTAELAVTLVPVISRLELASVESAGIITGFTVSAIYLFDYYPNYTYGSSYNGAKQTLAEGDDFNDDPDIALSGKIVIDDDVVAQQVGGTGIYSAKPANGEVWAFNVAAGSKPMLVVELTALTSSYDEPGNPSIQPAAKRYLRMTGYKSVPGNFAPATIYRIPAIKFDAGHIDMKNPSAVVNAVDNETLPWGKTDTDGELSTDNPAVSIGTISGGTISRIRINGVVAASMPAKLVPGWIVELRATPTDPTHETIVWSASDGSSDITSDLGLDGKNNLMVTFTVPADKDAVILSATISQ